MFSRPSGPLHPSPVFPQPFPSFCILPGGPSVHSVTPVRNLSMTSDLCPWLGLLLLDASIPFLPPLPPPHYPPQIQIRPCCLLPALAFWPPNQPPVFPPEGSLHCGKGIETVCLCPRHCQFPGPACFRSPFLAQLCQRWMLLVWVAIATAQLAGWVSTLH